MSPIQRSEHWELHRTEDRLHEVEAERDRAEIRGGEAFSRSGCVRLTLRYIDQLANNP